MLGLSWDMKRRFSRSASLPWFELTLLRVRQYAWPRRGEKVRTRSSSDIQSLKARWRRCSSFPRAAREVVVDAKPTQPCYQKWPNRNMHFRSRSVSANCVVKWPLHPR